MIKAVADSGPFIHLAVVNHVALLQRYFQPILILPQVYDEVVTQGMGRAGAPELAAACNRGMVQKVELADRRLMDRVRHLPSGIPDVSEVDVMVIALAIAQRALVLSDDGSLRMLATTQSVPVIGSVGILVWARLDGVIPALQPLLDQLIISGFHLDPHGRVSQDALRRGGSCKTQWVNAGTHAHCGASSRSRDTSHIASPPTFRLMASWVVWSWWASLSVPPELAQGAYRSHFPAGVCLRAATWSARLSTCAPPSCRLAE